MDASPPRPLGELLGDSATLLKESIADVAAIVGLGLVPGFVLMTAALYAVGLSDPQTARSALSDLEAWKFLPLFGAGVAGKLADTFAFVALVLALKSRDGGQPIDFADAFGQAAERFWGFLLAELRAVAWILGGLLLFIIPGIVLAIRYGFVHLAVLLEDRQGKEALARSSEIVVSWTGKVIGNLAAVTVLIIVVNLFITFGLEIVMAMAKESVGGEPGLLQNMGFKFVADFATSLVGAWATAFALLLYQDLAPRSPRVKTAAPPALPRAL